MHQAVQVRNALGAFAYASITVRLSATLKTACNRRKVMCEARLCGKPIQRKSRSCATGALQRSTRRLLGTAAVQAGTGQWPALAASASTHPGVRRLGLVDRDA